MALLFGHIPTQSRLLATNLTGNKLLQKKLSAIFHHHHVTSLEKCPLRLLSNCFDKVTKSKEGCRLTGQIVPCVAYHAAASSKKVKVKSGCGLHMQFEFPPPEEKETTKVCGLSLQQVRWQVQKSSDKNTQKDRQLMEAEETPFSQLTTAQKVKQTTKDVTYTGVIIVGVGVTALMFYLIGRELFSKQSPSGVYGEALKMCRKNNEVADALGEPIKGYGETTRRGRRRHVSHAEWQDNQGAKHMRMKFYVEGPYKKGTVHLEVKQNERGKYEHRYLFVELDGYPQRTIIIQDNR